MFERQQINKNQKLQNRKNPANANENIKTIEKYFRFKLETKNKHNLIERARSFTKFCVM